MIRCDGQAAGGNRQAQQGGKRFQVPVELGACGLVAFAGSGEPGLRLVTFLLAERERVLCQVRVGLGLVQSLLGGSGGLGQSLLDRSGGAEQFAGGRGDQFVIVAGTGLCYECAGTLQPGAELALLCGFVSVVLPLVR